MRGGVSVFLLLFPLLLVVVFAACSVAHGQLVPLPTFHSGVVHLQFQLEAKEINMTGPWEVNGTEEYSDKIIILDGSLVVKGGGSLTLTNVTLNVSGGDITVEAGGSLVLNNSTINIGCYFNGEHRIDVYGAFNATNGSSISSFDKAFLLTIHEEASVYIANTSISKCGYYLQTWGDHVSNVSEGGLLVKSSNTAIIDCTFTYCYAGVTVTASGVSIENSLFQSCVYGVVASEGWVNLRGCRVVNCDYGIHLVSSQNTVEGCIVEHAEGGAALYGSSNLVSGCNFSRCKHAVTVYGDGNLVENNRASEADIGFTVGGEGNNVTGNVAEGCKHSFYVVVSENGTFTNNMVEGSMHGFLVVQSGRNLFAGNTVKGTYYGFYLVESGRATITGNEISNCKYGVFVWFSDAEIRDNTFTDNDVNVFTFSLQTILALLLTLTSWSNQVMLSQTAIMAPIFLAAFVVYLRAREHVKRGYKKLGAAGAFLFAATIILLPFCLTESEDAGFNVSLLLIVYFIQSAPPLISNIYPTPAAYFGYYYYIYYPPFMLSFPYVFKGFESYFKYSLLAGALLSTGALLIGLSGHAFASEKGKRLINVVPATAFLSSYFLLLSAKAPDVKLSFFTIVGSPFKLIFYKNALLASQFPSSYIILYLAINPTFLWLFMIFLVLCTLLTGLSVFLLSRNFPSLVKDASVVVLTISIFLAFLIGAALTFLYIDYTGIIKSTFFSLLLLYTLRMSYFVGTISLLSMNWMRYPISSLVIVGGQTFLLLLFILAIGYILLLVGFIRLEEEGGVVERDEAKFAAKPEKWRGEGIEKSA